MRTKDRGSSVIRRQIKLDEASGYIRQKPPSARKADYAPNWTLAPVDPADQMAQSFIDTEWRVAELRKQITRLKLSPKGRTRLALATQLSQALLDPDRLATGVTNLSDSTREYYARLLLSIRLRNNYTYPDSQAFWQGFDEPHEVLVKPLVKAGLILENEAGGLTVLQRIQFRLPKLHIAFPEADEPETFVPATDPVVFLGQLQQMIGLLQTESFELRHFVRWQAPDYPYAQSAVCWPPVPDDVQALNSDTELNRPIELSPAEPILNDAALTMLASSLDITESQVEFLYHILVASGVLWPGSPTTVDPDMAQAWMTLPPGRQLEIIYNLYGGLTDWAAWWPLWRAQMIHLKRTYYGYWGLMSLDESVHLSSRMLRSVLLEILSFLPDNIWLSMADLNRWIAHIFPTTETHRHLTGTELTHDDGGWPAFQQAALVSALTGPLHALGLVDIGPSLDNVQAIRIRRLQDVHWQRPHALALKTAVSLTRDALQFDDEGSALEVQTPVPSDFMTLLLRWAKPSGFARTLVRYSLDVQQLHHSFEAGENPDSLSAAWLACTGFAPLPQVAAWWQYWWDRYGRVRLYPPQALLQTRDALTMQELRVSLPKLHSSIHGMLSANIALLTPDDIDALLTDLERQGYMPKESS